MDERGLVLEASHDRQKLRRSSGAKLVLVAFRFGRAFLEFGEIPSSLFPNFFLPAYRTSSFAITDCSRKNWSPSRCGGEGAFRHPDTLA